MRVAYRDAPAEPMIAKRTAVGPQQ
jgi:hypothetical protein